jgi:hypothetical protein
LATPSRLETGCQLVWDVAPLLPARFHNREPPLQGILVSTVFWSDIGVNCLLWDIDVNCLFAPKSKTVDTNIPP